MKKNCLLRDGYRLAAKLQAERMRYNMANAVNPIAASSCVRPKCLRMWTKTKYVASRVEKPVMPIMVGTCPTAMLMADPVMKAATDAKEMKSTIQPQRMRPMKHMMAPQMMAKAEAIT